MTMPTPSPRLDDVIKVETVRAYDPCFSDEDLYEFLGGGKSLRQIFNEVEEMNENPEDYPGWFPDYGDLNWFVAEEKIVGEDTMDKWYGCYGSGDLDYREENELQVRQMAALLMGYTVEKIEELKGGILNIRIATQGKDIEIWTS